MGLLHGVGRGGAGTFQSDLGHALLKELAILSFAYGLDLSPDHFDVVFGQSTRLVKCHRCVQCSLSAKSGEQCIGFLLRNDLFDDLGSDWFNVGAVGKLGVGHDRGGVTVDQDDLIAFFPQSLAGLDPGVVKFAGLSNNDWSRSDDKDGF